MQQLPKMNAIELHNRVNNFAALSKPTIILTLKIQQNGTSTKWSSSFRAQTRSPHSAAFSLCYSLRKLCGILS
jgi:hypothetical protein